MIRRLLPALLCVATAAAAPSRRAHAPNADQLAEIQELARSEEAEAYFATAGGGTDDLLAEGLRYYLHELGVDLPKQVPVRWNRVRREYVIEAEDELQARIGRALSAPGVWQVEVDAALIALPLAEVEKLARASESAAAPTAGLRKLWAGSGGRLLASARLVTRSGITATLFAGDEVAYAGQAKALARGAEPDKELKGPAKTAAVAIGTEIIQRRLGLGVEVTPTLQADLRTLTLAVSMERAVRTGQRSVAILAGDGANPPQAVASEVPEVRMESVTSEVLAAEGTTQWLGGLPAEGGQVQLYLLLTPRIVDAEGRSRAEHDYRGRLVEP